MRPTASGSEAPVDVDVLRHEIEKTYTEVSTAPEHDFNFPTGRAWACIRHELSEDARKRIDLWTGRIAGALLEGEHAKVLVGLGYRDIEQGEPVDTYPTST